MDASIADNAFKIATQLELPIEIVGIAAVVVKILIAKSEIVGQFVFKIYTVAADAGGSLSLGKVVDGSGESVSELYSEESGQCDCSFFQ